MIQKNTLVGEFTVRGESRKHLNGSSIFKDLKPLIGELQHSMSKTFLWL